VRDLKEDYNIARQENRIWEKKHVLLVEALDAAGVPLMLKEEKDPSPHTLSVIEAMKPIHARRSVPHSLSSESESDSDESFQVSGPSEDEDSEDEEKEKEKEKEKEEPAPKRIATAKKDKQKEKEKEKPKATNCTSFSFSSIASTSPRCESPEL
jgi:hypothetical protein